MNEKVQVMPKIKKYNGESMSVNERLIAAFRYMRLHNIVCSQSDVAKAMGKDSTDISMAFRGKHGMITSEFVHDFNIAFNGMFNFDWLMFGTGEMLSENATDMTHIAEIKKKADSHNAEIHEAYVERFKRIWEYLHVTGIERYKKDMASKIGCSQTSISSAFAGKRYAITRNFMYKIAETYKGIFNTQWVLDGIGNMLVAGGESPVRPTPAVRKMINDVIWNPIVPHCLIHKSDCDILEAIAKGRYKLEYLCSGNIDVDLWLRMDSNALYPEIIQGDYVGLKAYQKGDFVIPNEICAINTRKNGMVIRRLVPEQTGGYIALGVNAVNAYNVQFTIYPSDIIRIFRKIMIIRF